MESGRRIRHAQEMCRERWFSVNKDIRLPVLSFVCCVISRTHHTSLTIIRSSLVLSKVIRYYFRFLSSFLLFDNFCLLSLFVPIKVLCRSVT